MQKMSTFLSTTTVMSPLPKKRAFQKLLMIASAAFPVDITFYGRGGICGEFQMRSPQTNQKSLGIIWNHFLSHHMSKGKQKR